MSPCLTSFCPCRGVPAQAPRQRQNEVRQGDTHDSGSAAIRGVPLPNQQRKICDGPTRVKALQLGGQSGSSWIKGVCRHGAPTLYAQITPTTPQPKPSWCVPFGDPHVHKAEPSTETRQGCKHSSANTWVSIQQPTRTHHVDDKSKGRKKKGVHQQRVLC